MQYHPSTVQTSTSTRLGTVRLAASPQGLVGLWFDGQRHQPAQLYGPHAWPQDLHHPVLVAAIEQLHQYLRGERTGFELPLDLAGGTPFQQDVWRALLSIGCGHTTSYGALSQQLGRPAAVRHIGCSSRGGPGSTSTVGVPGTITPGAVSTSSQVHASLRAGFAAGDSHTRIPGSAQPCIEPVLGQWAVTRPAAVSTSARKRW